MVKYLTPDLQDRKFKSMKTKFDIEAEKSLLRIKRNENINQLKLKLERAYNVKAVLPGVSGYDKELQAEHDICDKLINDLESMLTSENTALLALEEDFIPEDPQSGPFQGIEV